MNNHICTIHKKTITLQAYFCKQKKKHDNEKNHNLFNRITYAYSML